MEISLRTCFSNKAFGLRIYLLTCVIFVISAQRRSSFSDPRPGGDITPTDDEDDNQYDNNLAGPNVCGNRYNKYCCHGWTRPPGGRRCTKPICKSPCGGGHCMRPNLCVCPNKRLQPSCQSSESGSPDNNCAVSCMNGGTCVGTRCLCRPGFRGPYCGQPVCNTGCRNGGRCIRPNFCQCPFGFSGLVCQSDLKTTGPCFTQVTAGTCRGQLTGVQCTQTLCCQTIGKAWGNPCQQCPVQPYPCDRGYIPSAGNTCVDIDECTAIPGICVGSDCINSVGSYRCDCREGQRRNPITNTCEDIDECSQPGICRNGECVNTKPGYYCRCYDGFINTNDRKSCVPSGIHESVVGYCYSDDRCNDRIQRVTQLECCCTTGINVEPIGRGWGVSNSSYNVCHRCPLRHEPGYNNVCTEPQTLDPCKHNMCMHGDCEQDDSARGYHCKCHEGYKSTVSGGCMDRNECEMFDICRNGRCLNTGGSFTCICNPGYDLSSDYTYCTDMDECADTKMCPNGECTNMDGSYKCVCLPGYKQSPNQQVCFDIDECAESSGRDGACVNGRCMNTPGSYTCHCNPGYQLSNDGAFCWDMNECEETGMCPHGYCHNMDGSYECRCYPGYQQDVTKKMCLDINECDDNPCFNGMCINTQGTFKCECPAGWVLDPNSRHCIDTVVGQCFTSMRDGQCSSGSRPPISVTKTQCCCADSYGVGWQGPNDPQCLPCPLKYVRGTSLPNPEYKILCPNGGPEMDECKMGVHTCENGVCKDMMGSYECECYDGYKHGISNKFCVDFDECRESTISNLCNYGRCRNTPGSFMCQCEAGFVSNENIPSKACEDIDECLNWDGDGTPCINGRCVNIIGSFRCECPPNFTLDSSRRRCVDKRRGACWTHINERGVCEKEINMYTSMSECCSTVGVAWGSPCQPCNDVELTCPTGYHAEDGISCVDVNECVVFQGICKGGFCTNNLGSFECRCPQHLTLSADGKNCIDLRQELCYPVYSPGSGCSHPTIGRHSKQLCCCTVGQAWGDSCSPCPTGSELDELCGPEPRDIDECTIFGPCANGQCRNTIGSYVCQCQPGYALDQYGFNCTDIDECRLNSHVCGNGICQNVPGTFTCDCEDGYVSTMMMQTCMDIDECARDPMLCRGGLCKNTIGSFVCNCPEGHELMPGGTSCKDKDECSESSSRCANGVCQNFMGGFECICNPGYISDADRKTCGDRDECSDNNGGCHTQCVNTQGSYFCSCRDGHHLMPDGKMCHDIEECQDNPNICNGGECVNVVGSYRCRCTDGLTLSPEQTECIDIDECTLNRNICENGYCRNTHGSFVCECQPGYSVKDTGRGCTDDNECDDTISACDPHARCRNTHGSYVCDCNPGFTGDGHVCQDTNECLRENGGCDAISAMCINVPGSYRCVCDEGFEGNGYDCRDVDECVVDQTLCENGHCLNFPGGFRCECDMGFSAINNERACEDIDECALFRNLCVNGRCENVFGTFRCVCNMGYELDATGGNCTDINECLDLANCVYGTCINKQGTYICQCLAHHELNPSKTGCVDTRSATCYLNAPDYGRSGGCSTEMSIDISRATCCCTVGQGWGESTGACEICPKPDTTAYTELCPGGPGFRPNTVTVILEDIDECDEIPGICRGGTCKNSFGSFICTCPAGYRMDEVERMCVDIDECSLGIGVCGVGTCMNLIGNYTCECPTGHMLMTDRNCMDMRRDNCYMNVFPAIRNRNRLVCERPVPGLTKKQCCCSSDAGKGWGTPCGHCPRPGTPEYTLTCGNIPEGHIIDVEGHPKDIDECTIFGQEICKNGLCTNTKGSYRCDCNPGYRYNKDLATCEDIDECLRTTPPCIGEAECINTVGSFKCECPIGYKLAVNGRVCIDIDECRDIPDVCMKGECINIVGSYTCHCPHGYHLSVNKDTCLDINECTQSPMCRNGSCENTEGSYKCKCDKGFRLTHNGDCFDVDECTNKFDICQNGRCRNTIGSFRCVCYSGYVISEDGENCRDVNECRERNHVCNNGDCYNTDGGFQCICHRGYELNREQDDCRNINECHNAASTCINGRCEDNIGSYICECPPGFILSASGNECRDVRKGQCFLNFVNGRCQNASSVIITKSQCCCMGKHAAWGENPCEICPTEGQTGFKDVCPAGLGYAQVGTGGTAGDINECALYPDICVNGKCINTDGAYRCECSRGLKLNGSSNVCIDRDECAEDPHLCGAGFCRNTHGGFECTCNLGYISGANMVCEDFDECRDAQNQCAFRCINTEGSFRCTCPDGFILDVDGYHCQDLDECNTPAKDQCRYMCKNLVGSYMCICPEGFRQLGTDGNNCVDIDECQTIRNVCEHGRCINSPGGYSCQCFQGYVPSPDGTYCRDRRPGYCFDTLGPSLQCISRESTRMTQVTRDVCCCVMAAAWGPQCEPCPKVGTEAFNKVCLHGPGYTADGSDIDECSFMPDACMNGRCYNTLGSYRCVCNIGFKVDSSGSQCEDINECELDNPPCEYDCTNTYGSYTCSCQEGYVLHIDKLTCKDIDECASGKHTCDHTCINIPGGYECNCPPGFRVKGEDDCEDIDECREQPNLCQPSGTCINTQGSYNCDCPEGFITDEQGRCVDSDECTDDLMCEYGCYNLVGSFRCECPNGFVHHFLWNQCVDNNECASNYGVCGGGSCINTMGGYNCGCSQGGLFDPMLMQCMGLGGVGCAMDPCAFGCTGTTGGFLCGCPQGYIRMRQDHCVQTVSPPGATFPPGLQLPHLPLPEGGSLPKGEGCYECQQNYDGLPLQGYHQQAAASYDQRQPLPLRQKRDTSEHRHHRHHKHHHRHANATKAPFPERPMVIDVSGPHGVPPADQKEAFNKLSPDSPYHQQNIFRAAPPIGDPTASPIPDVTPPADNDDDDILDDNIWSTEAPPSADTPFLMPDEPVILYLRRQYTKARAPVLKILPALNALKNNEVFSITKGNEDGLFVINEKKSIGSLRFTRKVEERGVYHLEILCTPLHDEGKVIGDHVKIEQSVIKLDIHIL